MATNAILDRLAEFPDSDVNMPALFVGHGSPTNAIEDNEFTRAWANVAAAIPKPRAILCVSAHWETAGTQVTVTEQPRTIYDFYGFPDELYAKKYAAPGSPRLAHFVHQSVRKTDIHEDDGWGLDHGAWSVLCKMYPQADIPVVQLSLDSTREPTFHYELGKELKNLRKKGVLILGSGNIVHNLRSVVWSDEAYDWAIEFDRTIERLILSGDHPAIVRYDKLGQPARLAIPTNEHFLPLLYVLALQEKNDPLDFFAARVTMGSLSMRSVRIG